MNFEIKFALSTLENKTDPYFVREAVAEQQVPREAVEALKDLEADRTATRRLIQMLRLY